MHHYNQATGLVRSKQRYQLSQDKPLTAGDKVFMMAGAVCACCFVFLAVLGV